MPKKISAVLVLLLLSCGTVFADDADEEIVMPKNTITVDVGTTAYFLLLTGILNIVNLDSSMYVIGIAAQYERQIAEKVSAAVRLEYGILDTPGSEPKWRMSSFSVEGHGRYYPGQGVFFLDGTLGYANVFADFSSTKREIKPSAHYFKFGAKLGWRIDFDKPGGFVLEPAVVYYGAVGTDLEAGYEKYLGNIFNFLTNSIARGLFVEGLRFSLGLGYRF
jgi:hypothetical protein